jgi:catalase
MSVDTAPLPGADASPALPVRIVDALKANAGNLPNARASFAKGQCVRGHYTPSAEAAAITRSLSFTQPSDIIGRFSVGGGMPGVADTNKAVLRGFALKLGPAGHGSDLLLQNAPVHFAKSPEQMLAFLQARAPGPEGKPDAEKVKAFSDANPETLHQAHFVAARGVPGSFAGITYWGVHAFSAINVRGEMRLVKFKLVPVDGELALTDAEAQAQPADFLLADLKARIAAGTARFDLLAILGRPGDEVLDLTRRWAGEDEREPMCLGRLVITGLEPASKCDSAFFDPGCLADGIVAPVDRLFAARQPAYAASLARRIRS